jgi:hypothetical protein
LIIESRVCNFSPSSCSTGKLKSIKHVALKIEQFQKHKKYKQCIQVKKINIFIFSFLMTKDYRYSQIPLCYAKCHINIKNINKYLEL